MNSDPTLQEPLLNAPPVVVVVEEGTIAEEEARGDVSFESAATTNDNRVFQGQEQPAAYRDVLFAIVFLVQLVAMMITAVASADYLYKQQQQHTHHHHPTMAPTAAPVAPNTPLDVEWIVPADKDPQLLRWALGFLLAALACAIASATLFVAVLQRYSHAAVQISFLTAPACSAVVAVLLTVVNSRACAPFWIATVLVAVVAAIHYCICRRFIPFAAANLKTGLQAVDASKSLFGYAAFLQVVTVVYWTVAVTALSGLVVYFQNQHVPCSGDDDDEPDDEICHGSIPAWMVLLWLLSVYWTQSVVQNVIRTTTAGAVGTWWFRSPEEQDDDSETDQGCFCCTGQQDVHDSWHRAVTYSFGSICFGSLMVAVIQVLEIVVSEARRQKQQESGHDSVWLCLLECIIEWLGRIMDYFNSWAFLYVGIYGYDYMTASHNVMTLFQQRGFTFLLTHRLVFQVMQYMKWSIGLVSGSLLSLMCALLVHKNETYVLWFVFFTGFVVGWTLAGMTLFVLESSVRTIMLCFVERPMDGAIHRPAAYQTLTAGWSVVYPEHFPHTLLRSNAVQTFV